MTSTPSPQPANASDLRRQIADLQKLARRRLRQDRAQAIRDANRLIATFELSISEITFGAARWRR